MVSKDRSGFHPKVESIIIRISGKPECFSLMVLKLITMITKRNEITIMKNHISMVPSEGRILSDRVLSHRGMADTLVQKNSGRRSKMMVLNL